MEPEQHNQEACTRWQSSVAKEYAVPIAIVIAGFMLAVSYYLVQTGAGNGARFAVQNAPASELEEVVLPMKGVELPVTWGDLGRQLVDAGAIDPVKMAALYKDRGGFPAEYRKLLEQEGNGKIVMTRENAGYFLNLLWALGLANKNSILEDKKEMMNPAYGALPPASGFASTGGWTIANGDAMEHYNMHALITLTVEQQKLVDKVSRNIFRPCCGNSTHFPDCNHGMAMLGLLELMASQGVSESDMYKAALAVNSYWFPDTYLTIAMYMQQKGVAWEAVSPKEMLGEKYSSGAGFQNISSQVNVPSSQGVGGGCGVDAGAPVAPTQQSGCGV
ncbi:hypothetical protein HY968_04565 [Candidatus Kaiserbacteria bacterium]|nr:hypothetical protein [Candidatus Kaiserbacteria bacterium]